MDRTAEDYDYTIDYHPGKANVVVDALSRKISGTLASLGSHNLTLLLQMRSMNTKLEVDQMAGLLVALQRKPDFVDQIKEAQTQDPFLLWILERMKQGQKSNFSIRADGVIVNGERICVPDVEGLRREILQEAHNAPYSMHPGTTKMYQNLRPYYWWQIMKEEVTEFVAKCDSLDKFAELYVSEIMRLRDVPVSIVSDRDPRFSSHFWGSLQRALGVKLHFSNAFQLQINEQLERIIQTLLEGLELVQEIVEKIQIVKRCFNVAQDRQKSYANKHRREMEYEIGDKVFLKVSPCKITLRFGKQGKLSPRYIGPYEIIERIEPLAYQLALPSELSQIHDVFHVSMLRRYRYDPSHIICDLEIEIIEELTYVEEPTEILDRSVRKLRNKEIPMVKVKWGHHSSRKLTWEVKEHMRDKYPYLFH
ncbi:UNVERIFIED_CONTAM: Transposon Tf2-11 polyprotein [Sesamum angustifolium]|uniref:Transposon Tf2-11 polyprotein n=1 Tax=Sesamum angustifolium TaxID=2727405 RepID=A0AAW2M956_9LAMI